LAAYSTISDGMAVYDHGNPISAFERDGAGYVADVARLGFSTSTTAFLVAPNPITGGVVIVTGVVWAGAEVVDHWDEIAEFWGETSRDLERGADWLYDELTGAHDWADNQASAVDDWARHQLDHLSRGWDWTADLASDLAGGRLDDARSWVDDRFDDLVHAGGGIVDGGIDVGRKIIPGW
jgi:hypothetical protein